MWNLSFIQRTQVQGTRVPLEYFHGTRVPIFIYFYFFKVSFRYNSVVQKSSFTLETRFLENRVSKQGHIYK